MSPLHEAIIPVPTVTPPVSVRLPCESQITTPWRAAARRVVIVPTYDQGLLEQAFELWQLASVAARRAAAIPAMHQITVAVDRSRTIANLVESGRVSAARQLLSEVTEMNAEVCRWASVLATPRVAERPSTGRGDFSKNAAWLRAHRDELRGKWVALHDGRLVDQDASRLALHRRVVAAGQIGKGLLFVKVD